MAAKTTYSNWTYISYKHQRNTTTNRKVYLTQATWCGINVHTVIRRRRRTQLQQQVYSPSLQTKWRRRRQQLLNNFPRFQTDLCGTRYWRAATRQLYVAGAYDTTWLQTYVIQLLLAVTWTTLRRQSSSRWTCLSTSTTVSGLTVCISTTSATFGGRLTGAPELKTMRH